MGEDEILAGAGINANLVYDRLLTVSDDAGLCHASEIIIKAKCFPMLDEMTIKNIKESVGLLVAKKLLFLLTYKGRYVVGFNPDSFQRIQKFRSDYRRRFEFGELSQLVWDKGLPGIRAESERIPCITRSERVEEKEKVEEDVIPIIGYVSNNKISVSATPAREPCASLQDAVEIIWKSAPQIARDRSSRKDLVAVWEKLTPRPALEEVIAGIRKWIASEEWSRDGGKFIPGIHRWLSKGKFTQSPRRAKTPDEIADEAAGMPTPTYESTTALLDDMFGPLPPQTIEGKNGQH